LPKENETIVDGVIADFLAMCRFPHGSWHEGALADALAEQFQGLGWAVCRDALGNLRADISATAGRESGPLVAIQGHMDMVCAAADGWDPLTDPVNAFVEDGVLRTDGRSSLGADNNLGNAAALYLLRRGIPHGPVRLLLTVAEEVGLQGARGMDPAWLDGVNYLINTDGFKLGRAVISSAGGRREKFRKKLHTVPRNKPLAYRLTLSGSLGGHSGYDINKGRANCNKLLTMLLGELRDELDYELAWFRGGHAHNAIPLEAAAVITADRLAGPLLLHAAERANRSLRTILGRTDPDVHLTIQEVPPPERVWQKGSRDSMLDLVSLLHNGVFAMHDTIPGQVSASSNIGRVFVGDDHEIEIDCFVRCAIGFSEKIIGFQHARAARLTGFHAEADSYPGWAGDDTNPLARRMSAIYKRLTGQAMEITAVHVGLEPSVLGAKRPDMVMVSTGPDILNPHSTDEHAPVKGLATYVHLLAGTLDELSRVQK
jgi:dipeptidase D